MQQPTLAPESTSSAEQSSLPITPTASSKHSHEPPQHHLVEEMLINTALRAHLLPHLQVSPTANSQDNKPAGSASPHDLNIDPAISGVGATPPPPPQQVQQQQQVQSQSPGVNNMTMVMGQGVPQGMPQGSPQGVPQAMQQAMPQQMGMEQHSGAEETPAESPSGKGRGGKRELSTSKRAAQNRAAQRAFRQRKEGYIKKLEEQVRDLGQMQESYKQIQAENYQLRDYIIALQSRLIESQGEEAVPPPPLQLIAMPGAPPPSIMDPNAQHQMAQQQQQQVPVQQPPPPQQHAPPAPMAPAVSQAPTANMGGIPAQAPVAQVQPQQPAMTADMGNNTPMKRPHDDETFLQSIAQGATGGNGFMQQQQQQNTSPVSKRLKNGGVTGAPEQELGLVATSGEEVGEKSQSNGS